MRAVLRQAGVEHPVDLDLEEEIRTGRLGRADELHYPPWTGSRFVRIGAIDEVQDLLDAVPARMRARLDAPGPAVGTTIVAALVLGAAAAQCIAFGGLDLRSLPWSTLDRLAVGFEPTLLAGSWWTVWTAHLLHDGLPHLVLDLPVLLYCAWRVERVLGKAALALVLAMAAAFASTALTLWSELPVVGSSTLAFGAWAAQITIGLRFGDALPERLRGRYGWGSLVFLVPLWLGSLGSVGVSQLGHAAGFLGGALAAAFVRSGCLVPRAEAVRVSQKTATYAGAWLLGTAGAALVAGLVPDLAGFPWTRTELVEDGVAVDLPARLAAHPTQMQGLPAWTTSSTGRSGAFCGLTRSTTWLDADARDAAWGHTFGGEPSSLVPRKLLKNGWSRLRIDADDPVEVVELDVQRGQTLVRCGYWHPADEAPFHEADAFYDGVFAGMDIGDPPALTNARAAWLAAPSSPSRSWDYAVELELVGRTRQADLVLAGLDGRTDAWASQAARARLDLWLDHPEVPLALDAAEVTRWMLRGDRAVFTRGADVLVRAHACDTLAGLGDTRLSPELRADLDAATARCVVPPGAVDRL